MVEVANALSSTMVNEGESKDTQKVFMALFRALTHEVSFAAFINTNGIEVIDIRAARNDDAVLRHLIINVRNILNKQQGCTWSSFSESVPRALDASKPQGIYEVIAEVLCLSFHFIFVVLTDGEKQTFKSTLARALDLGVTLFPDAPQAKLAAQNALCAALNQGYVRLYYYILVGCAIHLRLAPDVNETWILGAYAGDKNRIFDHLAVRLTETCLILQGLHSCALPLRNAFNNVVNKYLPDGLQIHIKLGKKDELTKIVKDFADAYLCSEEGFQKIHAGVSRKYMYGSSNPATDRNLHQEMDRLRTDVTNLRNSLQTANNELANIRSALQQATLNRQRQEDSNDNAHPSTTANTPARNNNGNRHNNHNGNGTGNHNNNNRQSGHRY